MQNNPHSRRGREKDFPSFWARCAKQRGAHSKSSRPHCRAAVLRGRFLPDASGLDAPLGQRWGGVFRLPPPYLWTPPTPQCNNDDRRQRRKQGGVVGAAASKTRVPPKARSGCWVPQPVRKGLLAPFRPQRGSRIGKNLAASLNDFFSVLHLYPLSRCGGSSPKGSGVGSYRSLCNSTGSGLALSVTCGGRFPLLSLRDIFPRRGGSLSSKGEPLAKPHTLRFDRKLSRPAKGSPFGRAAERSEAERASSLLRAAASNGSRRGRCCLPSKPLP